jgi:predicted nucleic acid-binding protein
VRVDFDWRPLLGDPDDDMVANCAANGAAECVVTSNIRHLRLIEQRFGIPVLTPDEFLTAMR